MRTMQWKKDGFTISTEKERLDRAVIHEFLRNSYWAKGIPRELVDRSIENSLIRAARALGATERQIFYVVVLPAAVPSVVTGLRLGAGMAIFVLVAAELLGSSSGLGWLIMEMRDPRIRLVALFLAPTLLAARLLLRIWLPGGLGALRSRRRTHLAA